MSGRAIDIHEGDKINDAALKDLIRGRCGRSISRGKSKA